MNRLFILAILPFLFGFTFNPMSQSIDLGENQKSAQFLLENETTEKQAIELTVKVRSMDENGKETQVDTKEISIFPPALIIPPKEKRTIRVNYNGEKDFKVEKSFRVIAEQLSVKVDEKQKRRSGIQMLMRYVAALYVTPKDAESKVNIVSYESTTEGLRLSIENTGNKHQIMADPTLTLIQKEKKKTFKGQELNGFAGENVLAQSKRLFVLKNIKDTMKGTEATLKFNE
jgi:fimbrial chaperone protein